MTREKSIDMFIMFLNVLAIMVLVGILSVMVETAEAQESASVVNGKVAAVAESRNAGNP